MKFTVMSGHDNIKLTSFVLFALIKQQDLEYLQAVIMWLCKIPLA